MATQSRRKTGSSNRKRKWSSANKAAQQLYKRAKRTWSRPKRKSNFTQSVIRDSDSASHSRFNYGLTRRKKGLLQNFKTKAPNYQVITTPGRITYTPGQQGFDTANIMYNKTDLETMMDHYDTTAAGHETRKVMHYSCNSELMIKNQDNNAIRIVLWDVVARRDNNTVNTSTPDAPLRFLMDGYETTGSYIWRVPGFDPMTCEGFKAFFKTLKKTYLVLSPGQTHVHTTKFSPQQLVNGVTLSQMTYGIKGLSCYTMLQTLGVPLNDSTTKTNVSTGSITLDYVARKVYKYTCDVDATTNYYATNNLQTITTESVMETDGDINTSGLVA